MRPEALLGAAAAVAVVIVVALAAFVPGFVSAPPPEPDEPPARLDLAEMTLQAGDMTVETATWGRRPTSVTAAVPPTT